MGSTDSRSRDMSRRNMGARLYRHNIAAFARRRKMSYEFLASSLVLNVPCVHRVAAKWRWLKVLHGRELPCHAEVEQIARGLGVRPEVLRWATRYSRKTGLPMARGLSKAEREANAMYAGLEC